MTIVSNIGKKNFVSHRKKVIVIIPARNEGKIICSTLECLKQQIHQPSRTIVVNDGSSDDTSELAKRFEVDVIDLKDRGFRATGKPVLAQVINQGLRRIRNNECHYIMILGADHLLPPDYILKIIKKMEENKRISIASGVIEGEPQNLMTPRGSGRIIRYEFWKNLGLKYPKWYGFESYIVYKALVEFHEVKVLCEAIGKSQRPTGKKTDYISYGRAMKALGYHPIFAFLRCLKKFKKDPKAGIQMFRGFCDYKIKKYDIASKVSKYQVTQSKKIIKNTFIEKFQSIFFNLSYTKP